MKKVIIVPVLEIDRFPGMSVIARGETIAALMGESVHERSRSAFASEDEFYDAVAAGRADFNTFENVEAAREFAEGKITFLTEKARRIEEAVTRIAAFPARKPAKAETKAAVVTEKIA